MSSTSCLPLQETGNQVSLRTKVKRTLQEEVPKIIGNLLITDCEVQRVQRKVLRTWRREIGSENGNQKSHTEQKFREKSYPRSPGLFFIRGMRLILMVHRQSEGGKGVERGQEPFQEQAELQSPLLLPADGGVKAWEAEGSSRAHRDVNDISSSSFFFICRSHHFVVMLMTLIADQRT